MILIHVPQNQRGGCMVLRHFSAPSFCTPGWRGAGMLKSIIYIYIYIYIYISRLETSSKSYNQAITTIRKLLNPATKKLPKAMSNYKQLQNHKGGVWFGGV